MELQPERPEGNRRRAKLHLGKIYFLKNSFLFHLFYPLQFVQPFGQVIGFYEIVQDVKFTRLAICF